MEAKFGFSLNVADDGTGNIHKAYCFCYIVDESFYELTFPFYGNEAINVFKI
jgi:hypothetical protein